MSVRHLGAVTIDHWDFNTPLVGPGMLFPIPDSNAHQGVFFPSPVQTYFSQPIPDGGPQVGYAEGGSSAGASGGLGFFLETRQPVSAIQEVRFTIDVGNSLPQAFANYPEARSRSAGTS